MEAERHQQAGGDLDQASGASRSQSVQTSQEPEPTQLNGLRSHTEDEYNEPSIRWQLEEVQGARLGVKVRSTPSPHVA
jgi:hypothetical protein